MTILSNGPIHFETLSDRPRVFHITVDLVAEAKARNKIVAETTVSEDLADLSWLPRCVGLVTHNDVLLNSRFPRRIIAEAAPNLRWIHVTAAGVEALMPLDWLPQKVVLTNNSGVHAEKVRESALMMLLMLNSRVPAIVSNQQRSIWQQIFTPIIAGKTVVIVGVGAMGGAVAEAARQLLMRVIGVRNNSGSHPAVEQMFRTAQIDDVLPLADFIVTAAPLTDKTRLLLDARRIGILKRGAGLVNIGRAGLIDELALAEALETGHLSGAILDVYDREPLPHTSPLWSIKNLVMMPHVTSDDEDQYLPKSLDLAFENFRRLASGTELLNVVNRDQGY
jgi:phosphoglycerate dehydrogenase-like enzyme